MHSLVRVIYVCQNLAMDALSENCIELMRITFDVGRVTVQRIYQ